MAAVTDKDAIVISNVTKQFGDFTAVQKLDLTVKEGEFVVILGASGCGKSTLLNMVAGFEQPTAGSVTVNGTPVKSIQSQCGFVFQQYALYPWKTVAENIEYGLKLRGVSKVERRKTAMRFIQKFGLAGFENAYPSALSGGMRQRVAIARVLANDAKVILMDEPFAALDAMTRQVLQEELLRIHAETRKTIVFITHSIDEALLLSSRIVIMSAKPGRIVQDVVNPLPEVRDATVQLSDTYRTVKQEIWQTVQTEVSRTLGVM